MMPDKPEKTPSVFISYAKKDLGVAKRLYGDLERAGTQPWIDTVNLLPGQNWKQVIREAIRSCDYFIALLSSHSVGKRGYVQREIKEALDVLEQSPESAVYLLPARLDECRPSHSRLEDLHWVDLFPSYSAGLDKILRVIRPAKAVEAGRLTTRPIVNRADLAEAGWAVIFSEGSGQPVREALRPLLELRRAQAGKFFREYSGALGYQEGDSVYDFLARHGAGPGPVDPNRVPYYILLVGDPEEIPFSFQQQLSIQYGVGRLTFDSLNDYAIYASNVVASESVDSNRRRAIFFGVRHRDDHVTELAVRNLVRPLSQAAIRYSPDWEVETILAEDATRERLDELLESGAPRGVLFVVAHGISFPAGDERQLSCQGAIVCGDWPGPKEWPRAIPSEFYYSASDIPPAANLSGTVVFYFGSFGAGTPKVSEWAGNESQIIAPRPFVSGMAKAMLRNPGGGALAFIGQIERGCTASFQWKSAGPQIQTFEYALKTLMSGQPVGLVLETFSKRYAELAAFLAESRCGDDSAAIHGRSAELRSAAADAKSYVIIGDPAARIK